ncbi:NAD-dependent epimerase/dehydratase family protein [Aquibium oceanicum]|uniref:UDP-glucose 4-epimerase n=1 Tax=Aquibium oceanicum TaxID=1670800 RepID=A0A1L3SNL4_9HYPH|nr:NAD(P)-dependent oxidoreductase [Aquibium oceanicum]APH71017.1 UDP-glucose 4-epimerase [Aquibium oceanicum]
MLVLVTGATGKVGRTLIERLQAERPDVGIRALCHNRTLPETDTLSVVRGSIADRETCREALRDVTHVVHLATCKETPDDVMDVTVKGLFWLLEEFRASPSAQRFLLIGGDAAIGHFFHRHPAPITEDAPHMAYPGCYALSKVLEEVMLEQFGIQYGMDWCCLRAPWIMEKDDFRHSLSFGDDLFGGPDWKTMVEPEVARRSRETGAVPLLQEEDGTPVRRNFVHVDDLVSAILIALTAPAARQRLFNVCMDEPVDYAAVVEHLARTRGLPSTPVRGPYVSNWMDNSRAKADLGWRPSYDLSKLIDSAWDYVRPPDEPRQVWYPG